MVQAKREELGVPEPNLEEVCVLSADHSHASCAHHYHVTQQGPFNTAALLRTFGKPGPPEIKLYRYVHSMHHTHA